METIPKELLQYRGTVLCHGVFDLLHLGHIRHLEEARALGDRLVVSITADHHVNKGIGRPHFTVQHRKEALLALECVDEVIISDSGTAVETIKRLKPAYYVKGIDYGGAPNPFLQDEIDAIESVGGKFHVTKSEKWSSSRLINAERFPDSFVNYLHSVRDRNFLSKIKKAFEDADRLRIAFVGETIIDEYCYVQVIGKPSKENCLAAVTQKFQQFDGGIIAASQQGEWANRAVYDGSGKIKKTRFVDVDFNRKLFEVYDPQVLKLSDNVRECFHLDLKWAVESSDAVIVLDFGHGLIDHKAREILYKSKFLAVNAQSNAGNRGYNPVTKYKEANLVCVDEPEARLSVHKQFTDMSAVLGSMNAAGRYGNIVVTHGHRPTLVYHNGHSTEAPTVPVRGIDTMGAGDAFLSVCAPLVAAGLDLEASAFVGNIAGAIKCSILGHTRHVTRSEIMQTVEALLS